MANSTDHNVFITVADEKVKYPTLDYRRAEKARELQNRLCLPSDEDLIFAIKNGIITDPGITRHSVCLAYRIFGPIKFSCKGKAVQHTTLQNYDTELDTEVPPHILEEYNNVALSADIFYVDCLPFLAAILHYLGLIQCICLRRETDELLIENLRKFDNFYQARGLKVTHIDADGQFKNIKLEMIKLPHKVRMEIVARNVHVKRAKQMVRLIKECVRGVWSMFPFKFFPKRLIIKMIYAIISNINAILRKHTLHYGQMSV